MRTTLTIDDDLAKELHAAARKSGQSFKEVVNGALRQGLAVGASPSRRPRRFRIRPKACGFRAGIDLSKLNQLVDDLDIERAGFLAIRDR